MNRFECLMLTVVSSFHATAAAATSMPIYPPPTITIFFAFSYKEQFHIGCSIQESKIKAYSENHTLAMLIFFHVTIQPF